MPDACAYVTLCTHDAYVAGAMVWANSLKRSQTTKDIVILITSNLSQFSMECLSKIATKLVVVDSLDSRDSGHLEMLGRKELGITFSKLYCWCLTEYNKGVFMDADTLVLQNIDELFDREEFSAAPDPGWPDCFNSGVFVFKPYRPTFNALMQFASEKGSFDGGDQGLLNMFFHDWSISSATFRLPFIYNCVSQAFYSYLPALNYFRSSIKVAHFIGATKPWHHPRDTVTKAVLPIEGMNYQLDFLNKWFHVFNEDVEPMLGTSYLSAGLSTELSLTVGVGGGGGSGSSSNAVINNLTRLNLSSEGLPVDERQKQYAWERGDIDYTGSDRFSNILGKIEDKLAASSKDDASPKSD